MSIGASGPVISITLLLRDEASDEFKRAREEMTGFRRVSALTASEFRTVGTIFAAAGAGILALGFLAAKAADSQDLLGQRMAKVKDEAKEFAATIGEVVLPVLLLFLDATTNMLELVNKLPDPLVKIGGGLLLIGGGMLAVVGTMALFISILKEVNTILKINISLSAISRALGGPIGIAQVGAALAVGVGAAVAVNQIAGSFAHGGIVPGAPGSPQLILAHGGEEVRNRGQGGGGMTVIIQAQAFAGSELEARRFAREIARLTREDRRIRTDGSMA